MVSDKARERVVQSNGCMTSAATVCNSSTSGCVHTSCRSADMHDADSHSLSFISYFARGREVLRTFSGGSILEKSEDNVVVVMKQS